MSQVRLAPPHKSSHRVALRGQTHGPSIQVPIRGFGGMLQGSIYKQREDEVLFLVYCLNGCILHSFLVAWGAQSWGDGKHQAGRGKNVELAPELGASHTTVPNLTLTFLAPLFEVGCLICKGH